jgi:hypothetical protein
LVHESLVALAAQNRVDTRGEQELSIESGVKTVEAEMGVRAQRPEPRQERERDAERGVHRNRYRHEIRPANPGFVEGLHGEIDSVGGDPGALQESEWRGETQGLMSELVTRKKKNVRTSRPHRSFMTIFMEKVQQLPSCIIRKRCPLGPWVEA